MVNLPELKVSKKVKFAFSPTVFEMQIKNRSGLECYSFIIIVPEELFSYLSDELKRTGAADLVSMTSYDNALKVIVSPMADEQKFYSLVKAFTNKLFKHLQKSSNEATWPKLNVPENVVFGRGPRVSGDGEVKSEKVEGLVYQTLAVTAPKEVLDQLSSELLKQKVRLDKERPNKFVLQFTVSPSADADLLRPVIMEYIVELCKVQDQIPEFLKEQADQAWAGFATLMGDLGVAVSSIFTEDSEEAPQPDTINVIKADQ